jgi:hypothetical protein
MNGQVGLAFTGGYLMGRNHKMRLALTLAGVAAGRRLMSGRSPAEPGQVKSSELGKLTKDVRGQLVEAGRSAAVTAASQRIDALSDRLEARATSLRAVPAEQKADQAADEKPAQEAEEKATRKAAPERGEARDEKRDEKGGGGERKSRAEAREHTHSHAVKHTRPTDRPAAPRKKAGTGGSPRRSQG